MVQGQGGWSGQVTPTASNAGQPSPQIDQDSLEKMERRERHMLEQSRVHLCSSVVVAEVQALKAEVEILKRQVEEETHARSTGDALNGEAVMQLQVLLEQRGHGSKLAEEISDLRLGLEAEVLVRMQADEKLERQLQPLQVPCADNLRSLRMEIEQEARQRKAEIEQLRNSATSVTVTSHEKWSNHSKNASDHQELEKERTERQAEDRSLHQLINTLAEQTNLALDEEAARLWEAIRTHNHDVIIEGGSGSRHFGSLQVQSLTKQNSSQQPRRVQLYGNAATTVATSSLPLHTAPTGSTLFSKLGNTDGKRGAFP